MHQVKDKEPPMEKIAVRRARPADAAAITACVCEAYLSYIERIGRQPAPMLGTMPRSSKTTKCMSPFKEAW